MVKQSRLNETDAKARILLVVGKSRVTVCSALGLAGHLRRSSQIGERVSDLWNKICDGPEFF
jgi:hypothetical protein